MFRVYLLIWLFAYLLNVCCLTFIETEVRYCECSKKNNQTAKNDEMKLANNPVRDLSLVGIFTRQNTACRRHATTQVKQNIKLKNNLL